MTWQPTNLKVGLADSSFPTFPWLHWNSLTFSSFPGQWSPWWDLQSLIRPAGTTWLSHKDDCILILVTTETAWQSPE